MSPHRPVKVATPTVPTGTYVIPATETNTGKPWHCEVTKGALYVNGFRVTGANRHHMLRQIARTL